MDAALITTDQRVRNLVRRFTRDELLNIVEVWFQQPSLRPQHPDSSWEPYQAMEHVQKSKVIDRLLNVDWTEGLCALQVAQLDLKYTLLHPAFKKWQLWRLKAVSLEAPLYLTLGVQGLVDRVRTFLTPFYLCHVYGVHHPKHDTHWLRISFFDSSQPSLLPKTTDNVYLIHHPRTDYVVCGGTIRKELHPFVVQALLYAFDAGSIQEENLVSNRLEEINALVESRTCLGPLHALATNKVDPNPLDIHQRVPKQRRPQYVSHQQERRRIVPLDPQAVEERYSRARALGADPPALESLEINVVAPPMNLETDDMTLKVTFKGSNVIQGLQDLIQCGIIVPPFPDWITDIVHAGANKVYVTRDGLFQEQDASSEE